MPIGDNISLRDKLIKKTTDNVNNKNITSNVGKPSLDPKADTYGTKKMTFYVKEDLLDKFYNFAYWERHNITEAFNIILIEGLKNKNTKPRPKE